MSDEIEIPDSCKELLSENAIGLLSTVREKDGLISTHPVGYVWDGKRVRVSTLSSRVKVSNLRADPRVTMCVVASGDVMRYVEIRGRASLADDPDRSFFREQFRRGTGGQEAPEGLDPPNAERVVITIHPEQVSSPSQYGGRFERE